ncbi:uncharacterized protein LY89DRAFT_682416 [Mollisia scopiformis]|uniref:Uncharacterized protein n=1 Tax=Mollisia scopiformis TaxID=149040 RepID=A0A194XKV3_MOLSC|nr:uncharacterized protein LY89DRAFT_682416 [Mollisia scopiformis]KUJ20724.1 hypothetical protein LY89DRAFT_682416 [Mollisia scopiformis]
MYYLNPCMYVVNSLLTFEMFDIKVVCVEAEYAVFDTPGNQSCAHLSRYMSSEGSRTFLKT